MRHSTTTHWAAAVAAFGIGVGGALTVPATAHAAGAEIACQAEDLLGESKRFACPLPDDAAAGPRRVRFRADFAGGHDDSIASMKVALDNAPLACDDGSRIALDGEFGDVYIDCLLTLPPASAASRAGPRRLDITLRWSHAQYTRAGLRAE